MAAQLTGRSAPVGLHAQSRQCTMLYHVPSSRLCAQMRCVLPRRPLPDRHTQTQQPRPLVAAASAAAAASLVSIQQPTWEQRVCRVLSHVVVGLAAAGLWSVCASAITTGSPFASMSLTMDPSSSGVQTAAKSAWAGLAAGFLHTLCGPDHLAALTPLTIGRSRGTATALGALWGFGHSTGQLILGLVFIVLKERFHDFLPALSKWSGTVVGLTLIAIGLIGIYETYFEAGSHGEEDEAAELKLAVAGADGTTISQKASAGWGTYATGIVYGLQPDALFVVIPALALPTKLAAFAYCVMFVLGTVAAMGGYTALIGTTSAALTKERPWLQSHLSTIASGVALVVGALILAAGMGVNVPFFS